MAWLTGWTYRKSITLSRASGAVTDYQMKLLVGESAGASGEDVDCGGKIQSGFHDLAFTTSDGTTLLDYWIDSITGISPNQLATVWIRFDSIGTGATTFYMYYGNSTLPDPIDVPTTCQWKRYPNNPILVVGAAGKWDDFWVQFNTIWKEGSTYYGYYQGCKSDVLFKIGLATSTDGVTWTKDPTADGMILDVGAGGAWDDKLVGYPIVWKEESTWYMLYQGKKVSTGIPCIGLATSNDGISWTKSGSNPVMSGTASTWDSAGVQPGTTILKEGNTYYFYYTGSIDAGMSENMKIGLATSTDLITWTKSENNPMLSGGGISAWDTAVLAPTVMKFGSTYYMWYEGVAYDSGNFMLSYCGIASSSAKDSGWSKSSGNPVLGTGGGTSWDKSWSEVAVIVNFGTEWRMYYGGSDAGTPRCQGGFATYAKKGVGADVFIVFDDFERVPYDAVGGNWTVVVGAPIISLDQSYGGARSCKLPATANMNVPATASANIAIRYRIYKSDNAVFNLTHGDGTHGLQVRAIATEHVDYYNGTAYVDSGGTITKNTWQILEVTDIILGTSLDIWINDVKQVNDGACHWNTTQGANVVRFDDGTDNTYLDNVIVRNYRTVEPAWGSWGSEESGFTKSLSDSFSLTDSLSNGVGLNKAETITLSDAIAKGIGKFPSDAITLSDLFSKIWTASLSLSDGFTLSEAIAKTPGLTKSDAIILSDLFSKAWTANLSLSDVISLIDAISKTPTLAKSDALTLTDFLSYLKTFGLNLSDTISLSDAMSKIFSHTEGGFFYEQLSLKTPDIGEEGTFNYQHSKSTIEENLSGWFATPLFSNWFGGEEVLEFEHHKFKVPDLGTEGDFFYEHSKSRELPIG